ncbi:hypothetical protein ACET3Z_002083 [Daucus carota]
MIDWDWSPSWTTLVYVAIRRKFKLFWNFPSLTALIPRRLWIAFTALSVVSLATRFWSSSQLQELMDWVDALAGDWDESGETTHAAMRITTGASSRENVAVDENDLEHLLHIINGKGGQMNWQHLMDRSTSNMAYQAWFHDPETGPVIYKSKTLLEDATPEILRDFFWDDEFRPKWDPMLAYFKMVEECPNTGTTIVHWIKKFPFFCSDREYVIGRRIWEAGKTFYCVTKTVQYPALLRRNKPRRVDTYFSSWVIKPVQSHKSDEKTACEVTLVHYEDMGIPKDVAKLGVRHGMWGTVKKMNGGFRAYQLARKSEAPISRSALVARNTTEINPEENADLLSELICGDNETSGALNVQGREQNAIDWKLLVIAGTVALAYGLHRGLISKTFLVGAGKRIARM